MLVCYIKRSGHSITQVRFVLNWSPFDSGRCVRRIQADILLRKKFFIWLPFRRIGSHGWATAIFLFRLHYIWDHFSLYNQTPLFTYNSEL